MGARTTGVLVSLAAPASTLADVIVGINDGVVAAATHLGASVLGGDLVSAAEISVSITAVGVLDGNDPVRLSGARPGDVLAVSGPLGASAAGHAVLADRDVGENGDVGEDDPRVRQVVDAFRCPTPDLAQGQIAARAGAHALTDISDGLVEELAIMAAASRVGVDVNSAAIPISDAVRSVARRRGVDPRPWSLAGGEDHEFLGAFGGAGEVPLGWTVIGAVVYARAQPVRVDGSAPRVHGWHSHSTG